MGVPDYRAFSIPPTPRVQDRGAVLVFHGSSTGITGTGIDDADGILVPYSDISATDPRGVIGTVSGAGDVNNDGFGDVVVGGTEIAVFFGSPSGVGHRDLTQADSRVQPGGPQGFIPFEFLAVDGAGDVNGDGFADIIAGSFKRDQVPFSANKEGAA